MKKYKNIDIELVKEFIEYNPDSGYLSWIKRRGTHGVVGKNVGYTHHTGYRCFILHYKEYMCHRVAWAMFHNVGKFGEIDHINGIRDDNRISNLRLVDRSGNQQNKAINSNNTSGHTGVYKCPGGWFSIITKDRVRYRSGVLSYTDACMWYRNKKKELHHTHGEYVYRENTYKG